VLGHAGRSGAKRSLEPPREHGATADMGTSCVDSKQDQGTHFAPEVLERFTASACAVLSQRV
jgi:hypothetical protein